MDYSQMPKRNIIVIDMKSFFATVECVERGLDPFKTPLVVAEPGRNGAITLAVTPYMKSLGIKGRTRIYDIPPKIKYEVVPPRMKLYIEKSREVVSIYQEFISEEDINIYSIDECFLDVTNYLKMYKKTDYELAKEIISVIQKRTGLIGTAGIGPNMLIAKVAMDIEAKHNKDNIAKWTYADIKTKFWSITPLSKFWGIGKRMEKNLTALGIKTVGELAHYDRTKLKSKYGIIGEELWNHANGLDFSSIKDYNHATKDKSYGHSQVLFRDYDGENIRLIIREMLELLAGRLRKNHKKTTVIGFGLSYSKNYGGGFYHSRKVPTATDDVNYLSKICFSMLERFYEDFPIRKVSINLGGLVTDDSEQLNIFEDYEKMKEDDNIHDAIDTIKNRFGANSILKASSLLKDSTAIERNKKIRGNRA